MQPAPADRICDPAAGTGGFLCNAYRYVLDHHGERLDRDQLRALQEGLVEGMELSPKVGRMCAMNVYLHNIGGDKVVVHTGHDSLAAPWRREYSMVLANPPFGKKQSLLFVNEEGDTEKEDQVVVREDFWTSTSNKQLNFVQHIYTLLKIDGRADPWTDRLWVYDLRTNRHFTLKQKPIRRTDFDEFIACYKPGRTHERVPTWSEDNPGGRWRCYDYDDLRKRDKLSLDLFWIKDEGLTDADSLPPPEVIAAEVADDLQAALDQFASIAARLRRPAG